MKKVLVFVLQFVALVCGLVAQPGVPIRPNYRLVYVDTDPSAAQGCTSTQEVQIWVSIATGGIFTCQGGLITRSGSAGTVAPGLFHQFAFYTSNGIALGGFGFPVNAPVLGTDTNGMPILPSTTFSFDGNGSPQNINPAGTSQITAKVTEVGTTHHALVLVDKNNILTTASTEYADAGLVKWQAGMVQDDNYDIYSAADGRTIIAALAGAPFYAAYVNSTGLHAGLNFDATGTVNVIQVATPSINVLTTTTGGVIAPSTLICYRVSATNASGETLASTEQCATTGSGTSTNAGVPQWSLVPGTVNYKIYGRTTGAELLIATISASNNSYTDTGSITPSGVLPAANTTLGGYRLASQPYPFVASLTTTAATSDVLAVAGMTSTGHCSLTATNALAATNVVTTWVSAKAANQITVTHTATASMTYDAICTPF